MSQNTLIETNFNFPGQTDVYKGKVRDVYSLKNDLLVLVATDRISAFDVILPKGIPFKGQVLNQLANRFLNDCSNIVPTWKISSPDPNVTIGLKCKPYKVEMVIRGYLTGHAWRTYKSGARVLCGVSLPEDMVENQKFERPIITPATKAEQGNHDEDISREEIIARGIISEQEYIKIEEYTYKLFEKGTKTAAEQGLILVDTKYEFGRYNGEIYLIDEIHTPDSSRYFYAEGYEERLAKGEKQRQLSKEFVREWLLENSFNGSEGQVVPEMSIEWVNQISARYIELYEQITGERFEPSTEVDDFESRINRNIERFLDSY